MVAFNFHPERCVGCGSCVTACLDINDIDLGATPPHRRLYKKESVGKQGVRLTHYSVGCMHCEGMPCGVKCPKGCFTRDGENGLAILDSGECIGCGLCAKACPYQAVRLDAAGKASKCNGCRPLLEEGGLPACVTACPRGAITVTDKNDVLEKGRTHLSDCLHTLKPY